MPLAGWGRGAGSGSGITLNRRSSMSKAPNPIDTALRDAIRGSGLTHYALGKAAGVAPAQLDRFVSGERSLSLASAAKVAAALGLVLVPRR
jgi:plasmid maintenance system antidote protein VapI